MAQITLISIYLPLILSLMPFPLIVLSNYKKHPLSDYLTGFIDCSNKPLTDAVYE